MSCVAAVLTEYSCANDVEMFRRYWGTSPHSLRTRWDLLRPSVRPNAADDGSMSDIAVYSWEVFGRALWLRRASASAQTMRRRSPVTGERHRIDCAVDAATTNTTVRQNAPHKCSMSDVVGGRVGDLWPCIGAARCDWWCANDAETLIVTGKRLHTACALDVACSKPTVRRYAADDRSMSVIVWYLSEVFGRALGPCSASASAQTMRRRSPVTGERHHRSRSRRGEFKHKFATERSSQRHHV